MAEIHTITIIMNRGLLAWLLVGIITGCSTRPPAPVEDYGQPADSLITPPSMGASELLPTTTPKTAAASALLNDARLKIRAGDMEGAAEILERTLRIEPRNPLLWSELAYVRSQQGKLDAAEQLAVKSNSLAAEDVPLQAHNWRLIAEVKRQLGDDIAASDAEQRARDLGLR